MSNVVELWKEALPEIRDGVTGVGVWTALNACKPIVLEDGTLVLALGHDDSELIGQVLLGTAMRILHDHPVLSRAEIRDALALSELDSQFERLRITPMPVSSDELSKLWAGFQSEYR